MAGAGLIAIKRRMKSVVNTRKITKAMGLVATAKLRKTRTVLTNAEQYNTRFSKLFKDILNSFEEESVYIKKTNSGKRLYVVFTSETGLCGGYNMSVVNKTMETAKIDKENSLIMVIGQKGRSHFKRFKYETTAEYVEVPDVPTMKESNIIAKHIIKLFKNNEVNEVFLVYSKFMSSVKLEPVMEKLLPLNTSKEYKYESYIAFEPSLDEVFEFLVEQYIKEEVFHALCNAKSSEHASRMNAMDGATKNANDLLDKLNLKYNRIRQSSITQEISEIVGGAEAQK